MQVNRPAHCDTDRVMNVGRINKGQSGQVIDSDGVSSCLCVAHGVVPIILEHDEEAGNHSVDESASRPG